MELQKFIEAKLELTNLSLSEKRKRIEDKIEELAKATEELKSYRDKIIEKLLIPIKEIENKIRKIYPELQQKTTENKERKDKEYEIFILYKLSKYKFKCYLNSYKEEGKQGYELGIYFEGSKHDIVASFLKPILKKVEIKEDKNPEHWYGGKSVLEENAYNEFKKLLDAVKTELEKQKKRKK
jgi:hypothetical protein